MHTFVFLNVWFMCNLRAKTHFLILAVLLEYLVFHHLIYEKTQVLVSFKLGKKKDTLAFTRTHCTLYSGVPGDKLFIFDPSWTNMWVMVAILEWRSLYSSYSEQNSSWYLCRCSKLMIGLYMLHGKMKIVKIWRWLQVSLRGQVCSTRVWPKVSVFDHRVICHKRRRLTEYNLASLVLYLECLNLQKKAKDTSYGNQSMLVTSWLQDTCLYFVSLSTLPNTGRTELLASGDVSA